MFVHDLYASHALHILLNDTVAVTPQFGGGEGEEKCNLLNVFRVQKEGVQSRRTCESLSPGGHACILLPVGRVHRKLCFQECEHSPARAARAHTRSHGHPVLFSSCFSFPGVGWI